MYQNNGGTWEQIGDNIIGEEAEDQFGFSISLSSNGNKKSIINNNYKYY